MADVPIAVNNVIRLTFFQSLFSQRLLTVLHLRCKTAPTTGTSSEQTLLNIATRFSDETHPLIAAWKGVVSSNLTFLECRAQRVWPSRTVYQKSLMVFEGTAAPASTANVAASIEKRTLLPGRHGIGRVQMGGLDSSQFS